MNRAGPLNVDRMSFLVEAEESAWDKFGKQIGPWGHGDILDIVLDVPLLVLYNHSKCLFDIKLGVAQETKALVVIGFELEGRRMTSKQRE